MAANSTMVVRPNYQPVNPFDAGTNDTVATFQNYQAIVNGQSIYGAAGSQSALIGNDGKPYVTFGDLSPSTNPQTKLDNQTPNAGVSVLRFPSELPRYYMTLSISDYHRSGWMNVGTTSETARIVLPLPSTMVDNQHIRYDTESIGAVGALSVSVLNDAKKAWETGNFDTVEGIGKTLGGVAGAAASSIKENILKHYQSVGSGIIQQHTGALGKGLAALSGMTVNDFLTVMMKGPSYKVREFIWRFSPQTADESETLRKIIQLTNNKSAPSLPGGLGSLFFRWPSIWRCKFEYVDSSRKLDLQTFQMKPAVLTNVQWNYTPNGVPSFYAGTSAPESIEAHFQFMELEYWLDGDYPQ